MAVVTTPPVVSTDLTTGLTTDVTPIIIDLGKAKRKRIKDLKAGRGRLMAEISGVVEEARLNLGIDGDGRVLVPVILIYKQKRKRKRRSGLALPLPFPLLS